MSRSLEVGVRRQRRRLCWGHPWWRSMPPPLRRIIKLLQLLIRWKAFNLDNLLTTWPTHYTFPISGNPTRKKHSPIPSSCSDTMSLLLYRSPFRRGSRNDRAFLVHLDDPGCRCVRAWNLPRSIAQSSIHGCRLFLKLRCSSSISRNVVSGQVLVRCKRFAR